jgi:MinD superfamily P-loop ATPase
MKEIVIISGKGGTGKTSVSASFAHLAQGKAVVADCDVDAADLHLILQPDVISSNAFTSGKKAAIIPERCKSCGNCMLLCRFDAIRKIPGSTFQIDPIRCEGCGVCSHFCPYGAVEFLDEVCGDWFHSSTRFGTLIHAKLGIAAENSGKLVTLVRSEAKKAALDNNADFVIIDGSPGIGCPVIASLTAADCALIVAEPTVSGLHDFERIADLTRKLSVPAFVCINKFDINQTVSNKIEECALSKGINPSGVIRYDRTVTDAQRQRMAVTEFTSDGAAQDISLIWSIISGS